MPRRNTEEYEARCNGRCEICGRRAPMQRDHDHVLGRTRGKLCRECNLGLGLFDDNSLRLQAALAYIEWCTEQGLTLRVGSVEGANRRWWFQRVRREQKKRSTQQTGVGCGKGPDPNKPESA